VRKQLSWTHLKTLAYENDPLKRQFYMEMASNQRWNTRTLADQIDKMLYERTTIAQQPRVTI
jgi:predicted nuclease of restriction endonuclease-like (RecB) superfamily